MTTRKRTRSRRPHSAEVTLCTAGQPSGNDPSPSAHKKGALSDEDSNIVYNRICVALQTLIDEAQLALQKNPSAKQAIPNPIDDIHPTPLKLTEENKALDEATMRSRLQDNFDPEHNLARRKSPRSSITLLDSEKIHDNASYHDLTTCSPTSYYSATGEVSRIYWKQKHEEQHDRYRKSSHRLTLELDRRFHNLTTDSDDSEASSVVSRRSRSHVSSSAQSSTPSTPTTPTQPLQGILRSSKKDGAKKERLKKKYQVQFLNADIPESRHRDIAVSTAVYTDKQQLQQTQQRQPQYTSRSVGSTRSRGVILQLYDLWQHTWLRTRIMHVITGSVEIVIIIWVVVKASRFTLTWLGFQPTSVTHWITFIYGHRDSAGAGAKELYAKIRKDGLQMRQFKAWSRKEPEALIEDFVAGAAASSGLISPSKMVYGPAKRAVAHAVTGMALALLSDGARRLVRKL
ncbi:hypothetical protein BGZ54_001609 [Gamsiella multidivaricata]|nr:hypothetical protein BGZ54_001609 [Gamsiella multidivaricata]